MAGKKRRVVWVPSKKAAPTPRPSKTPTGRVVAKVVPVPKTPRPVQQSQLPDGLWDSITSDPRATIWERDKRDPPESYFDGRSPTGLIRPEKWECKYGCPGVQVLLGTNVPHHAWNCPYWYNEGKNETPF